MKFPIHYPTFFTATVLEWKPLLQQDNFKDIIINSLEFLVKDNRVEIFGFVIMKNHIHLIWRVTNEHKPIKVQQSFMKYTAQMMIKEMKNNHPKVLEHFKVNAKDRTYQIWERNSLSVEIRSNKIFFQKLHYIHQNPVKAQLVEKEEDYFYSSASLYLINNNKWKFLKKWED